MSGTIEKTHAERSASEQRSPNVALNRSRPLSPRYFVIAVAVLAGLVASTSDAAPTGMRWWDSLLTFALAAITVMAVARARRWVAIVFSVVPMALIGLNVWYLPAAGGLGLAIASGLRSRRDRRIGALAAGLSIQALLRLPAIGFFGLPTLIGTLLIALAWAGGYSFASGPTRLRARRAIGTVAVLLCAIVLVGGIAGVNARVDADRGVRAAQAGLEAARAGESSEVVSRLGTAREALARAEDRLGSLWAKPLALVPVLAQHREVALVAVDEGIDVAEAALLATREADLSSMTLVAGSLDLAALSAAAPHLDQVVVELDDANQNIRAADSPWLVGSVRRPIDRLSEQIDIALPEARIAAQAATVVPPLLGADRPRHYLVMFGTPAESRELGGLFGSWALLRADNGSVSIVRSARVQELNEIANTQPPLVADDFPAWYLRTDPVLFPQNLTSSPDIGLVGDAARLVLPQVDGRPIDGLVYVDLYTLVAMLELSGPVEVEGLDFALSTETALDLFSDGQYRLEGNRTETFELFAPAVGAVVEQLQQITLPGPERLGELLGPVARAGRLQVFTHDATENSFFESVRLQRRFGWPVSAETGDMAADAAVERLAADGFAVVQTNSTQSKLDLYLQRDVTYDVRVDEDGGLTSTASVVLSSFLPPDPPLGVLVETEGVNAPLLSLYTPHELTQVRIDGVPLDAAISQEFGYWRYLVPVEIQPNTSRTVEFDLVGQIDPGEPYDVAIWHQPLVNSDQVHVRYEGVDGPQAVDLVLVENTVFSPAG